MKDLSKQEFEGTWKKALDGAEIEPSPSIWSAIELNLANGESEAMSKKVLYYKWMAAASVFFAVFISGLMYFYTNERNSIAAISIDKATNKASHESENVQHKINDQKKIANNVEEEKKPVGTYKISDTKRLDKTNVSLTLSSTPSKEIEGVTLVNTEIGKKEIHSYGKKFRSIALSDIVEDVPAIVHGEIELPRLVLPAMSSVFMNSSKMKTTSENLWASVGFSAGSYNPGHSSTVNMFNVRTSAQADYLNNNGYSSPSNSGSAYSAGFAMSKRVFPRWVIQSGINYINQNIGYTSNYVAYSANNRAMAFVVEYADLANESVTITSPYQINSAIEIISLPVQTGYLLINRKFGWQLNTGVAADFFIRNTLRDQSGNTGKLSQGAGQQSPYRAVSWAGLLGTELSYKVARQYRISVVPSMRYSINSVLKTTIGQESNPLIMDIGFRFRYIFK